MMLPKKQTLKAELYQSQMLLACKTDFEHLFLTSQPVISHGPLEINSCESISTAEIDQCYTLGLSSSC